MFGAKCSPSVAEYCLQRTATEFTTGAEVYQAVMEDTYVNDVITGVDDAASAIKLARGLTATLRKEGFELGPWISNSEEVLDALQS